MTTRKASVVRAALTAKGATVDENHHQMLHLHLDGVVTLQTRISQGVRELDDFLIAMMSKQCALRKAEFLALVDCTLSGSGWAELVRERCRDGRNPYTGR